MRVRVSGLRVEGRVRARVRVNARHTHLFYKVGLFMGLTCSGAMKPAEPIALHAGVATRLMVSETQGTANGASSLASDTRRASPKSMRTADRSQTTDVLVSVRAAAPLLLL